MQLQFYSIFDHSKIENFQFKCPVLKIKIITISYPNNNFLTCMGNDWKVSMCCMCM